MREVYLRIHQVASTGTTVLIRGESGTGKELVASAVHYNSLRAEKPLVKVNCAALSEGLLESELFGHEKGAFTGALFSRVGRIEEAEGGTLFLDEIGDFSPAIQVKLLRVLQEREYERVGSNRTLKANVRIIAATNRELETAVEAGLFRQDLYYRVNVFPIVLPPLRERKDDILLLADHFVAKYAQKLGKDVRRISTPAINMMAAYHWPGNVRELENCIEYAVLLSRRQRDPRPQPAAHAANARRRRQHPGRFPEAPRGDSGKGHDRRCPEILPREHQRGRPAAGHYGPHGPLQDQETADRPSAVRAHSSGRGSTTGQGVKTVVRQAFQPDSERDKVRLESLTYNSSGGWWLLLGLMKTTQSSFLLEKTLNNQTFLLAIRLACATRFGYFPPSVYLSHLRISARLFRKTAKHYRMSRRRCRRSGSRLGFFGKGPSWLDSQSQQADAVAWCYARCWRSMGLGVVVGFGQIPPEGPMLGPDGRPLPAAGSSMPMPSTSPTMPMPSAGPGMPMAGPPRPGAMTPAVPPEEIVLEVRVEGNRTITLDKIMPKIRTRVGRPYLEEQVQQDVRELSKLGVFASVRTFKQRVQGGVVVIFQVVERPLLQEVIIVGNETYLTSVLKKEAELKVGDAADPFAVENGRRKIEEYYQKKGYSKVRVTVLEGNKAGDLRAVFVVNEGPRQRIFWVNFVGNQFVSSARLKTHHRVASALVLSVFRRGRPQADRRGRGQADRLLPRLRLLLCPRRPRTGVQ